MKEDKTMDITIRVITESEQGFHINSVKEIDEFANAEGFLNFNLDILDPDNNKKLQIDVDESYTFTSLYKDICAALGVEPEFAIDSDRPALFDMMIELNDNYLLNIEDYNVSVKKIIEAFNSDLETVYLLFILGRGEVYRGDGIVISMSAEPGIRHNGAHVHVRGGNNNSATIQIDNVNADNSTLSPKEFRRAKKVIKDNIDELQKMWKYVTIEGVSVSVDYKLGRIKVTKNEGLC